MQEGRASIQVLPLMAIFVRNAASFMRWSAGYLIVEGNVDT